MNLNGHKNILVKEKKSSFKFFLVRYTSQYTSPNTKVAKVDFKQKGLNKMVFKMKRKDQIRNFGTTFTHFELKKRILFFLILFF